MQDLWSRRRVPANSPVKITWGEVFAVLPFGNRTTILTLTGAQLKTAFLNGFSPVCNPAINTGRFPQVSGLKATFHCNGTTAGRGRDLEDAERPGGHGRSRSGTPDTVRFVTNDFMYTGGDGYTIFANGTNVQSAGRRPDAGRDRLHRRVTRRWRRSSTGGSIQGT